jgi:uncharacterized protein YecE (DUF72 family)
MKYGFQEDISTINFKLPDPPIFAQDLIPIPTSEEIEIFIGSSVWSDKDFKGHFYPEKTAQKNFLIEYAKQFKSVEVNSTRYGTPRESTLNTWKNSVPDDFRFSFKMPQIISMRKNLLSKDVLFRLEEFILAIDKMGKKAGTTFILLQNNFSKERLSELEEFLKELPQEQEFAVEIRNPKVNQSYELCQLLNNYNIANVITDTAGERNVVHKLPTNNTAFIRFVGNGLVDTDYTRIDEWVKQFNIWIKQGIRKIYCLHHQPNQKRSFAGYSAKYMVEEINRNIENVSIMPPVSYKKSLLF